MSKITPRSPGARTTEHARTAEALRQSEERLRLAIDGAQMGSWDWDMQTGEILWSPHHETIFGFKPGTPRRTYADFEERLHPEDAARVEAAVRESMESRADYACEFRVVWPDGSIHWVSGFGRFHRDAEGRPVRMVGMVVDITERRQVEEALRRNEALYRAIGESIDYGVWVCAPDGRNTYASESFLNLVGITQEQCSNFGWGDVLHPDDADRTIAAWKECVRTGGMWDIEHRFRGVDGKWHPVLARGVPLKDERGQVLGWAGINLDITARKEAEEALRQAHDSLERRVNERTADLRTANAKLRKEIGERQRLQAQLVETTEREQQRIGRDLHDDLCQQLTGIELHAEALKSQLTSLPSALEEVERIGSYIRQASLRARTLARGLSPVQLEADGLMLALHELVASISELFRVPCEFLCASPVLIADPSKATQIYRIAQEAISNAVRHAHAKRVVVSLARSRDGAVLTIADDGVGCPAPDSKSTGMGLRTMQYRSEMIGATLRIEAGASAGTVVTCEFQPS